MLIEVARRRCCERGRPGCKPQRQRRWRIVPPPRLRQQRPVWQSSL